MRILQFTTQARLALGHTGKGEETLLEVAQEKWTVLLICDRRPLRVQQRLDSFDDVRAMGEKEGEQVDVGLKRCGCEL
jgi:hypothetical protein